MRAENKLTREFLTHYPAEAARVIEQIPSAHIADFLNELSPPVAAPVVSAMIPARSAAALELMSNEQATALIVELPVVIAARIYRLLSVSKRNDTTARLPEKKLKNIRRFLKFNPSSVGSMMDSSVDILPGNINVAEALRRIERNKKDTRCEIYITDEAHHFVGSIGLGKLLVASQHARLSEIVNSKVQKIMATTDVSSLIKHPAWLNHRFLPVVDRENNLLGVLDYKKLQEIEMDSEIIKQENPIDNLASLAAFYWISAAQMLVGIFSVISKNQGEQR